MKRQRVWLLAAAALFGVASWVVAMLAESTRTGPAPDERPIPGTAAALPPANPPLKQNEGTDFPNMRPTPQGASEAGRMVAAAPVAKAAETTPAPTADADSARSKGPQSGDDDAPASRRADGGPPAPFAIDKDGIRSAMRSALPEMKECYDSWLQMKPGLAGTLNLSFVIAPDADAGINRVTSIGLADGGMGSMAFEGCVLNSFSDIEFQHQSGDTRVTYPIVFSTNDDE